MEIRKLHTDILFAHCFVENGLETFCMLNSTEHEISTAHNG